MAPSGWMKISGRKEAFEIPCPAMKTSSAIGSYQDLAGDQHLCQFPILFWGLQIPSQTTILREVVHSCMGFWFINLQTLEGALPAHTGTSLWALFYFIVDQLIKYWISFCFLYIVGFGLSPASPRFSHTPNRFPSGSFLLSVTSQVFLACAFCYPFPPSSPIVDLFSLLGAINIHST